MLPLLLAVCLEIFSELLVTNKYTFMHIHKKDLIATIRLSGEEINLETANLLLKDPTLRPYHIVINLSEVEHLEEEELDALFYLSEMFRSETGHSFVVVSPLYDPDTFPEELVACPTLQEALDIIEMEDIERDLFKD